MLELKNIRKRFGGVPVLEDISFRVEQGERRALIGPNGAGKTTLLNIVSGLERLDGGRVVLSGRDVTPLPPFTRFRLGLGRTFQTATVFNDDTVRTNVLIGLLARREMTFKLARPVRLDRSLHREASRLLETWGLEDVSDVKVAELSYGTRRIVEVAIAMAGEPRLLLLDEPAAGLSAAETREVIEAISRHAEDVTILLVEHDMDVVFRLCSSVTVLAAGHLLAEGTPEQIKRDQRVIDTYLGGGTHG